MCQTRGKSYRPSQERTSPRLLIEYTWALFSTPLKKTRRKIRQEIRDFHRMGVWFLPRNLREKRPRWADTSDKMLARNSIVRGRLVCFLLRWIRWQHRNVVVTQIRSCCRNGGCVVFPCHFPLSFELKSNASMSVFVCMLLLRPVLLCYSMQVRALWCYTVSAKKKYVSLAYIFFNYFNVLSVIL